MPNRQYLLLFPSLLYVLLVILARRRVHPGPCCSCRAVPALCATCAQVCVTARAGLIYVPIAREPAGCARLIRAVDLIHPSCNVWNTSCLDWVTQVHVSQRSVCLWKILNMDMRGKHLLRCCVEEAYCVRTRLEAFPNSSSLGVELRPSHRFKGKERNICEELGSHFGELSCLPS